MKKYIIGLFSAICLMGAGCTEFEDYPPVDMGEGPAVEVSLTQIAGEDDAFARPVAPAEGTVYYSYVVSNDSLVIDADQLLQGKYEGSTVLNVADQPSVNENFMSQEVGVVYYVYAVAANEQGLCGTVASASLDMPDRVAPHLINIPEGYLYQATNNHRSVTLTFNETVTRGEGAITYDVARGNLESYASGTIETVVIDNETVTITLPESVVFDENEAKTYVFLDFAAGAFVDASGNPSAAMQGGVDEETQIVGAPYWEYVPGGTGGDDDVVIEIDDETGYGSYVFTYTSLMNGKPYYENVFIVPGSELQGSDSDYGVIGMGGYMYDEGTDSYYIGANIADGAFNLDNGYMVGLVTDQNSGTQYALAVFGVVWDEAAGKVTSIVQDETLPFVPNAEQPLALETDVVLAYAGYDRTTNKIAGFFEILDNCTFIPERLADIQSVSQSFTPSINRAMKASAIKKYLEVNQKSLKVKPLTR